jgi:hypothetical protein
VCSNNPDNRTTEFSRWQALVHIAICVVIGLCVSAFTDLHWLAVAFWCSAVLFLNGSIACVEDSLPGGFDNPDGCGHPLGVWFIIKSLGITFILGFVGFGLQSWLGAHVG